MTATTTPAPKTRLPVSARRQHLVDRCRGLLFGGDVILDPLDGVLERGGVRCCGRARELGPPDEVIGILVNPVARDCILAYNRFRQQRIIIHGHGLPLTTTLREARTGFRPASTARSARA